MSNQETKTQPHTINPMNAIKEPFEPWLRAAKAYTGEVEKLQQITMENMGKMMDESYRWMKEGLDTVTNLNQQIRHQWTTQMEKAGDVVRSFIQ